jgi:surfeit locus 1 family protein
MSGFFFRPLPGLTIAALVALAIAVGLGTWQLQRRAEKHAMLAQIEARKVMAAVAVELLLPVGDYAIFRPATATGTFLHKDEAYVSEARTNTGPTRPGVRVMTPFRLTGGDIILVDRGWVPLDARDPATRADGQVAGVLTIEGAFRRSAPGSSFTPPPDLEARTWFRRNAPDIAAVLGFQLRSPLVFEATSRSAGGPEPLPTAVNIPDNHLNYALTWFSLGIVLVVVYLRYHMVQGRLGFRR